MKTEELREQTIQNLADLLRSTPFTVELKVKKNPTGIKIFIEVTQEYMDEMMEKTARKEEQKWQTRNTTLP